MWRKKKLIVIAALAAIVLMVGAVGGIALAQTPPTGTGKTLLARVATILGIDQNKLEDAFAQAQKEQRLEALDSFLKNQVTQGRITQQQADQYKQWIQSQPNMPQGFGRIGPGMMRGGRGFHGPMMRGWGAFPGIKRPAASSNTTAIR